LSSLGHRCPDRRCAGVPLGIGSGSAVSPDIRRASTSEWIACEANCISKLNSMFSSVERDPLKRSRRASDRRCAGVPLGIGSGSAVSPDIRRASMESAIRILFAEQADEHGSGHLYHTHVQISFALRGKTKGELTPLIADALASPSASVPAVRSVPIFDEPLWNQRFESSRRTRERTPVSYTCPNQLRSEGQDEGRAYAVLAKCRSTL
jgi:hypothetical protein